MGNEDSIWTIITVTCGFGLFGLLAILLTLIGLPGIWLMIAVVVGLKWWQPEWISWWMIGSVIVLAILGEVVELLAGAAGSSKAGGSKRAAVSAVIGGIVGAIAGAAFPPIIGAVIWGTVGAGVGAILGELTNEERDWKQTLQVGGAAATGKLLGTLAKTALAVMVYILILVALMVP